MIKDKPEYIEKLNEIEFNLKNVRIIDIIKHLIIKNKNITMILFNQFKK